MAKDLGKQVDANKRWAEALAESNAQYSAGNAMQTAASCLVDLDNMAEAVSCFEQAVTHFRLGESEKSAGNACLTCGKALEKKGDKDKAIQYFDMAVKCYQDGEALLHSRECFDYLARVYIAAENWPKALENFDHQINMGIAIDATAISCKAALSQCVVYLCTARYEQAKEREDELRAGKIDSWNTCTEKSYFRRLCARLILTPTSQV